MHSQLVSHRKEAGPGLRRASFAALLAALLIAGPALAGPPPPPPPPGYQVPAPPPPPVVYGPGYYPPPPPNPPPPLPIAMRVIYAPFYAAGLVIRYGVYYVLVAPFEVLWRTVDYGVEGGVEHHQGS
jgi:hypothetical protein